MPRAHGEVPAGGARGVPGGLRSDIHSGSASFSAFSALARGHQVLGTPIGRPCGEIPQSNGREGGSRPPGSQLGFTDLTPRPPFGVRAAAGLSPRPRLGAIRSAVRHFRLSREISVSQEVRRGLIQPETKHRRHVPALSRPVEAFLRSVLRRR